jgi:hypothetical protein
MEPTGSNVASENGKVERPNGTFGAMVRWLLYIDGLRAIFLYAALVHAVYFKNHLYNKALHHTLHEALPGENTVGSSSYFCGPRNGTQTQKATCQGWPSYRSWSLTGLWRHHQACLLLLSKTNREKLSTHDTIDEAHYIKTRHPSRPQTLMDMGYEQQPVPPAITTPPLISRYPLRSQHKTVMSFLWKIIPLLTNEFNSAPFAVIASVTTSDIDHNNRITVIFSTDPFGPSFPETLLVSGIHLTLGLDLHYDHCQLVNMAPGTQSHRLFQWKPHLQSAYILSIDTVSIHTVNDVRLIVSEACSVQRNSIVINFTNDDALNCLSAVVLPQLYVGQLRIMRGNIENTVIAVVHKAITGPKFNHHTLHEHLDWKEWLVAEWIQLGNYADQNMFGAPCNAPIDA